MPIWEELKSCDIRKLDRGIPVVTPIGAIEAHGHLPVGCDNIVARKLAANACEITGAILAPSINYGLMTPDDKEGDVQVEITTFTNYLYEVVESFYLNGFKKHVIVNGHGGNIDAIDYVCSRAYKKYPDVKIRQYCWWLHSIPEKMKPIVQDGSHADRGETDIMLAIREDLVDLNKAKDHESEEGLWYYTPNTELEGHPTAASLEEGKKVYSLSLNNLVKLLDRAKREDC